jgi:mannose-6-phosphate isomerase
MQARPHQDPVVVTDQRPWGSFERFTLNEPSTVKLIYVGPGERLSLQRHEYRDELWVALDPGAVFEVAGLRIEPEVGERMLIRAGDAHPLSSGGPAIGSWRSPSGTSTRTTSSASRTTTGAPEGFCRPPRPATMGKAITYPREEPCSRPS